MGVPGPWTSPHIILPTKQSTIIIDEPCQSIEESLKRNKKKQPVSDETIHRLANPDWHILTPIQKWGQTVLDSDSSPSENNRYSAHLELMGLQRQLDSASVDGNWKRKDLDLLMGKILKLKRNLLNGPHTGAKRQCVA